MRGPANLDSGLTNKEASVGRVEMIQGRAGENTSSYNWEREMKDMVSCAFRSLEEKCLWSHGPQCSCTSQKSQSAFENELPKKKKEKKMNFRRQITRAGRSLRRVGRRVTGEADEAVLGTFSEELKFYMGFLKYKGNAC